MSKNNEFDILWDKVIKDLITDSSKLLGVRYRNLCFVRIASKAYYNKQKKYIIKAYMQDTNNIDRHKVSACIMKTVLKIKPLYIPISSRLKFIFSKVKYLSETVKHKFEFTNNSDNYLDDIEKYYVYLNEYLCMSIAVSILDGYINSNTENRFKHKIVMPEPFPEPDEDYLLDVCIGLHHGGVKGFNPITYANVLFLWEKYSCRKTQCDNIIESYTQRLKDCNITDKDIAAILDKAKYGI